MSERTFTPNQLTIVQEYGLHHGILPEQISFDGDNLTPSFDHNAISVLTLKLTDIADISPTKIIDDGRTVTVFGSTTLPSGRSRGSIGSCSIGDILANGQTVENTQVALGVATSRSFRQGIRNVGIDLHRSHQHFMRTGEVDQGHTNQHPRAANYREVHRHADELEYIVDGDESVFRSYLAGLFDGRTSKDELNDLELHQLLVNLRTNVGMKRRAAELAAA